MSWSLRVSNGDLVLDGGHLGTTSGEGKLLQDLRHYLLEKMGSDPMYPWYGSLIDGGRMPNGRIVNSPIGGYDFRSIALDIETDIRRIAADYQRRQLERAKADRLRYNKTTLTAGEILAELTFVNFEQRQDALVVHIGVMTGNMSEKRLELHLDPVITR